MREKKGKSQYTFKNSVLRLGISKLDLKEAFSDILPILK